MELRSFFSLTVKVVEAQGLLSVDGGTRTHIIHVACGWLCLTVCLLVPAEQADSYVEVFVDRQKKAKTRTIAATKNPSYAQEFYLFVFIWFVIFCNPKLIWDGCFPSYVPSDAASVTFNVMDEVEGASQGS
jgi:hypothetical protein